MTLCILLHIAAIPTFGSLQHPEDSIEGMVKKLGSPSFREREAASKALRQRPEAAPALRAAVRSADVETRRRAAEILEFFDRALIRELHAAARDGRVEALVKQLAEWPKGKYEHEAWTEIRKFAKNMVELHEKAAGAGIKPKPLWSDGLPTVITQDWITERHNCNRPTCDDFFIRAQKVDLDYSRGGMPKTYFLSGFIVAADSVRTSVEPATCQAIFAGGKVVVRGYARNLLIVGCAEVWLDCDVGGGLVIAQGDVKCGGHLRNVRIVSGKSVHYNKKEARNCIISENDLNPLGFIRWSDAPKQKSPAKAK